MNLSRLAAERLATKGPVGVAVIGAGKFGSMFLSQAPTSPGLRVAAIADLDVERAPPAAMSAGTRGVSRPVPSSTTAPRRSAATMSRWWSR